MNLDDEERQEVAGICPQDWGWVILRCPPKEAWSRRR